MRFVTAVRSPRLLAPLALLVVAAVVVGWLGRAIAAGSAEGTTFDGGPPLPVPARPTLP